MALDFSCPDWEDKLARGETPMPEIPVDPRFADVAVGWFDTLRLPDVPGQPTLAEAGGDWMRDIVRAAFGAMETSAGRPPVRLVSEIFLLVPKKNAKTTSAAGIALTFMLMNARPHADALIIGPTQKIADVAFQQARGMIEADAYLTDRFHINAHEKTITDRTNKARLMVRTFAEDVLTGSKPVFCLIDEVHILGKIARAADVIRQIRGGMMPFPEALLVMITTQSDHPPAGVFRSELQYARAVRDGRITEGARTLAILYEFPERVQIDKGKPWLDPANWHLVTPNLNRSISLDRLVAGYQRARADGDAEVIAWATQHLNVQIGLALHSDRWIGADFWLGAAAPGLSLEQIRTRCDVLTVGIDGGGLDDLAALTVIGRDSVTKQWLHWCRAWVHPAALEQRKELVPIFEDFEAQGDLVICQRPTQDIEEMAALCASFNAARLLPEKAALGLDPYGVAALVDALAESGISAEQMVAVSQGAALSPAIWGLERKLSDGTFSHGGQELAAWAVSNAKAEQRGNAVYITKQTAGKCKIDPLVATFNAVMLMTKNPAARKSLGSFLASPVLVAA